MRKNLMIALAIAAPFYAAAPAIAFDAGRSHTVTVEGNTEGTWKVRSRVVDTGDSCRYTIEWSNDAGPPLNRTVLCKIDEFKASDNFDCEENRTTNFDTFVEKASGTCNGFDDFGQETAIDTLEGGENDSGISGIFVADSIGDVQTFSVD